MDRRRARGHPALLRRVRWGNVGRLAALLAAGTLIAMGGRACGEEPSVAPPEELGAGLDRRDREPVEDALGRAAPRKDRAEARRPPRRLDARPAERQPRKRQQRGERPSGYLRARGGPPAPAVPSPVGGDAGPPADGEAGPPVSDSPPGGAEQITPPDEEPRPPKSGEFTPDPAP